MMDWNFILEDQLDFQLWDGFCNWIYISRVGLWVGKMIELCNI